MKRRPALGWLLLIAGTVIGALARFTAWGTFHPGFGFETMTVPAAIVGTASTVAISLAAALLGRPVTVSAVCVAAAILIGVSTYQLAQDIPGATARTTPVYADLYRSRLQTLWLAGLSASTLLVIGATGFRGRRDRALAAATGGSEA